METIIFDFGNVLINWNPRNLYRKIFMSEERMEYFLANICTNDWNAQQDAGRTWVEGTHLLVAKHPEWEKEIRAYRERWEEMLDGAITGTVEILRKMQQDGKYRLIGLTNWSAETFPIAIARFDFLQLFEGIVVSGHEKMKKPEPAIYELVLSRYHINPKTAIFIDDSIKNIEAARKCGISAIHFQSVEQLATDLREFGVDF